MIFFMLLGIEQKLELQLTFCFLQKYFSVSNIWMISLAYEKLPFIKSHEYEKNYEP